MLIALSDTHGSETPRLTSHLESILSEAEVVVHAGDIRTAAVLDAFEGMTEEFAPVAGNTDSPGVVDRVPATRTLEYGGYRFVVAHGHEHDETALSLLVRQEAANIAIVGHSHRPTIDEREGYVLVNPGSHADPRGNQPGYARFEPSDGGPRIQLRTPEGDVFDDRRLSAPEEQR